MILVQCKKDVFKASELDFIEYTTKIQLFKAGYYYMAEENEKGQWAAHDEEDFPHIISDGNLHLDTDYWFHEHFQILAG